MDGQSLVFDQRAMYVLQSSQMQHAFVSTKIWKTQMDVDHPDRSQFFYWARQSNPINQFSINSTVGLLNIFNILLNPVQIFSIGLLSVCCPVDKKWTIPNLCFCMLLLPYLGWFAVFFPARLPSPVFPKVGQRTQFSQWPCHLDFSLINGLCIYFFGGNILAVLTFKSSYHPMFTTKL